ncbi:30S ribosomal protein S12 methylthiotransferase RimO [Caldisericum exile]|uniref:Ribosomal protein uS12 methylthiotransferase RimO n=1 Tax=Caldisericum exile (strain DSM 21853 / NBRC 104410 / AZM16c01) TaxID=511051 RepID=A0A7U6JEV6_CALEA|nr:30S ribosomal protein S12 methylthiotransferase RimO [Caldisericum exile]BAL80853.1 putative ribosomal protein S12 methylthiotransferase RimO [Caldisericum exile AZM16c01]
MKKVSIISLGCPKNLVDSERVLGELATKYSITFDTDNADIVLINTCAFLKESRAESEEVISEFVEKKQKGKIDKLLVLGCYPSLDVEGLKRKFPSVDGFVGTNNLRSVLKAIENGGVFVDKTPEYADLPRLQVTLPHYSYLKIADGCSHRCAFCLIPKIKGNTHSYDIDFLVREAKALSENGVKELVLIAQDTTQYGIDLYKEIKLIELLKELEKIDNLEWIRILYTYPHPYMQLLIEYIQKSKKIVPYIDMPIQHASDKILKAMLRAYSKKELESIVSKIKESDIAFRTSVIVGFPTEGEDDFKELEEFIEKYGVDHIGIFKYSNEFGTESYTLEQVDEDTKEERFKRLNELKERLAIKRSKSFLGKEISFIVDFYDSRLKKSFGRSIYDAPDIDNVVIAQGKLKQGEIYRGIVKEANPYEWVVEIKK